MYKLRDLVERSRILGESRESEKLGPSDLRLVVRALLVVSRTISPVIRYSVEGARRRAGAWNLTSAAFSTPSAVCDGLGEAVSLLTSQPPSSPSPAEHPQPSPSIAEECNSPPAGTSNWGNPPLTSRNSDTQHGALEQSGNPAPSAHKKSHGKSKSTQESGIGGKHGFRGKRKSEPAAGVLNPPKTPYNPPPTKKRASPQAPAPLGPMPKEGPHPQGGFRRIPTGDCHTPVPRDIVKSVYCPPETVAELIDNPVFPEAWRAALACDPQALSTIASRCARQTSSIEEGGKRFGNLMVSGPLKRRVAWMHQIPDPEDVRVVILYNPLPFEDLAQENPNQDPQKVPAWSTTKGGLSTLLAALGNRLLSKQSHSWAGNWTGKPSIDHLNSQGVLLLSTKDLAFAGCVEYLCLRLGSARRQLIVFDTIDPEDWPELGPAVSQYHVYIRAKLSPSAYCSIRWPGDNDLSRAVLASSSIAGPGSFTRVEAVFTRLYPNSVPLNLCSSKNVSYTVATAAGEKTVVPLHPRDYRHKVLPAYDGCKDMNAQRDGLRLDEPDFVEGTAFSHRACNRWGLGAPIHPIYLASGRRALCTANADQIPKAVKLFCREAVLEPSLNDAPLVLSPSIPLPKEVPCITWEHGFGSIYTKLSSDGRQEVIHPKSYHSAAGGHEESQSEVDIVSISGAFLNHPKQSIVKIEILSDDENTDDLNPYV